MAWPVVRPEVRSQEPGRPCSSSRRSLLRCAAAVATGLVLAVAVVAAPLPASAGLLTALVLLSFAVGWALVALVYARTDRPQSWTLVPAAFLGLSAAVAGLGPLAVHAVFRWTWPPVLLLLATWSFLRVRRQVPRGAARWLLGPLVLALGLAALGGGFVTVHGALDRRAHPLPGRLVDVNGHRLHLSCTGSGSPTVVLEPGAGAASADLRWIAPAVATGTRVCVYDRAGRGGSEDADGLQDGAQIVADLHVLLERAQVPGPYVLAGHSFGGLYVLSYAARFPDQVAGLVLLDSTSPARRPAGPEPADRATTVDRVCVLLPALGRLGPGRSLGSAAEEYLAGGRSVRDAASLTDLGARPLLVLTADSGHDAAWTAAQDRLAELSTNHLHRFAPATHESLVADEDDSAAASRAVLDVVAAVRTSRSLDSV
jgi:pimeloyl-ACP methyl ester carboxylesterase